MEFITKNNKNFSIILYSKDKILEIEKSHSAKIVSV